MKHIMIDLETLGNTSSATVLSISAVQFDIDSGKCGEEFHVDLELKSQIKRTINQDTILWWLGRDEDARNKLISANRIYSRLAIKKFNDFLNTCSINENKEAHIDDLYLWGNSARFDIGILKNLMEGFGLDALWNFRKERCLRTLVAMHPHGEAIKESHTFKGIKHYGIDDCKNQIKYASKIYNLINGNN